MLKALPRPERGFTMVELLVAMSLVIILGMLAAPSVAEWIRNARVRSTAEALQNGLRLAQNEAIRRGRQVVLTFTNANPALNAAPVANGANWSAQTVPRFDDGGPEFIRGGPMGDVTAGIAVTTNTENAACFGSTGMLVTNLTPGPTGAVCNTNALVLNVSFKDDATAAKTLRVTVSVGGRIHMCDADKIFSDANPDGCRP